MITTCTGEIWVTFVETMAEGGAFVGRVSARPIHSLEEQLSKFPAELLDSPCADAHLVKLSQSIAEWRDLSPYLRLSPAEERGVLTAFPPATPARQCIDMLRTWRDKFGANTNYRWVASVAKCDRPYGMLMCEDEVIAF